MNICVFYDYEVEYFCKYSYINEDGDFSKGNAKWKKVLNGGKLLEWLSRLLADDKCIEVAIKDNKIYVGDFNPNSGETSDVKIVITELACIYEDKKKDSEKK